MLIIFSPIKIPVLWLSGALNTNPTSGFKLQTQVVKILISLISLRMHAQLLKELIVLLILVNNQIKNPLLFLSGPAYMRLNSARLSNPIGPIPYVKKIGATYIRVPKQ
jgi:hypothetical protein